MKIVVVLCEGGHDVAFLYRILKSGGFKEYSKEIGKMHPPLDKYIATKLEEYNYNDWKLKKIRPPVPSAIMKSSQTLFLLYGIGGIKNHDVAEEIIDDFSTFIPEDDSEDRAKPEGSNVYSFAIIFDADEKNINDRVKTVCKIFSVLPWNFDKTQLGHGKVVECGNTLIGCFIFTGDDNKHGKLEDIILPMMRQGNEDIFDDAQKYYRKYRRKNQNENLEENNTTREKKSTIGITGQLQKPGCSNSVIIQASKYVTKDKIAGDKKCREIIEFFKKLI
jgi:hypothetical protein